VNGTENSVQSVSAKLAAARRVALGDLRVEQTTLEDAFLALTGRPIDKTEGKKIMTTQLEDRV